MLLADPTVDPSPFPRLSMPERRVLVRARPWIDAGIERFLLYLLQRKRRATRRRAKRTPGEGKTKKSRSAHWVMLDRQYTCIAQISARGDTDLYLEPFASDPQLEGTPPSGRSPLKRDCTSDRDDALFGVAERAGVEDSGLQHEPGLQVSGFEMKHAADLPVVNHPGRAVDGGGVPVGEVDHINHTLALGGGSHLSRIRVIGGQGLFAEHVQPAGNGLEGPGRVEPVGGHVADRIKLLMAEHLIHIGVGRRDTEAFGKCAGTVRHDIATGDDLAAPDLVLKSVRMPSGHTPRSHDPNSNHSVHLSFPRVSSHAYPYQRLRHLRNRANKKA